MITAKRYQEAVEAAAKLGWTLNRRERFIGGKFKHTYKLTVDGGKVVAIHTLSEVERYINGWG